MTDLVRDREPEVDEALLDEAKRALGTTSTTETINTALRRVVEEKRASRRRALADLQRMSDEGAFNYDVLGDLDN